MCVLRERDNYCFLRAILGSSLLPSVVCLNSVSVSMQGRQTRCLCLIFLLSTVAAPPRLLLSARYARDRWCQHCGLSCHTGQHNLDVGVTAYTIGFPVGDTYLKQDGATPHQCRRHNVMRHPSIYWRRGRRLSNLCDSHVEDLWEF